MPPLLWYEGNAPKAESGGIDRLLAMWTPASCFLPSVGQMRLSDTAYGSFGPPDVHLADLKSAFLLESARFGVRF